MGEYRKYIQNSSRRKSKRNQRLNCYLYFGTAVLIIVAIICTIRSFSGIDKKDSSGNSRQVQDESGTVLQKDGKEKTESEQPADNPDIRVLIKTSGYANLTHASVTLSSASGLLVDCGGTEESVGQSVSYAPDDPLFQQGRIRVRASDGGEITVDSIERGIGCPSYAGVLELQTTAEGMVVINELPVESYLQKVVPSEMPASYESEALKAQAVCARNYTYRHLSEYAYPEYEAHVNDSTDFQVYGNSGTQQSTDDAVDETAGEVLLYHGDLITTYYYSTSCGVTTTMEAWGTACNEQNAYLQSIELKDEDGYYEEDLPWYRWEADIPEDVLSGLIGFNTGVDIGMLQSLEITGTGPGGVVTQICAVGDLGEVTIDTENKIRRALGGTGYTITKNDGTTTDSGVLLPSAFFSVEYADGTYMIKGGGYGHGIGMSQNGANEMAKKGMDYREILTTFFSGVTIEKKTQE